MTSGGRAPGNKVGTGERLPVLGRRSDLPPRVRNLLEGLQQHAAGWFQPALARTMTEIDGSLFRMAERSGNSAEQQRRFEALRAFKQGGTSVQQRFHDHLEADLARTREPAPTPAAAAAWAPASLELVDAAVLEEDLGLREIAGKADIRNGQALHAYTHRFAVIAGSPVPSIEEVPLGPTRITEAFRHAVRDLDLDLEHRLFAYRQFDRAVMATLAPFYDRINTWLGSQRVLPNLQHPTFRRPDVAPPADDAAPPADGSRAEETAAPAPAAEQPDSELFGTLRDLLGAKRRAEGTAGAASASCTPASRDDLQSVLATLQRAPSTPAQQARYDSEHFKNTLLVKLRRASPEGRPLGLGDEDLDTVDLVGMLFDYVVRNVREGSGARSLLTRLHVPVLRVALGDKSFFTRRDHPARELLNTIAETGTHWFDESDADPDLSRKMQMVVDHVSANFDGDVGVFDHLLGDLSKHMQLLARRAEVVERRNIDAARGRDRLEIAREAARAAVIRILQATIPAPRVRSLLEQAWTDALALSALREGPEGSEFKRRVEIAENIARRGVAPLADTPDDEAVRQELEGGLRQVGLHGDDVRGLVDNLFTRAPTPAATAQLQRIDEALKDKPRLGGEAAPITPPRAAPAPLTPAETEMLQQLKRTPFGTWFEFVRNQQGDTVRRKLAWFSPVTGHCLFVNQRGARVDDHTLEQVARDMARGQIRPVVMEQGSLIDRAWKAIVGLLRAPGEAAQAGAGARP
ncbi:MAG: DUF1631 family protein [Dokdonella sp.]|uniref:DUF1631 family protein n=1 Tax=Dokdonella sp. TaxID=2291710 RepID=UPI003F8152EF